MKNLHFLLFTALIVLTSCHKDDDRVAPIDQLPPATQTGAGTFGCLVNGKPFIDNSGSLNCFYQFVNGGYYFGINGDDEVGNLVSISIGTYNKELEENQIYPLTEAQDENAWGGGYFYVSGNIGESSTTGSNNPGTLKITKMDVENYIVSGTFSFDLIDPYTGETVEIREGRFDSHLTL